MVEGRAIGGGTCDERAVRSLPVVEGDREGKSMPSLAMALMRVP